MKTVFAKELKIGDKVYLGPKYGWAIVEKALISSDYYIELHFNVKGVRNLYYPQEIFDLAN